MISKQDIAKLEGLLMLVALAENNSKKKVAESLSLSVDTLNKYLADLEKELGIKLVTSNGRGSVLTHEAQHIIKMGFDVKKVIRGVDVVASHKNTMSGVVRVGLPLAVASVLHADGIDEFWQNYPNIRIESVSHYQSPNLNVLDVDLGFMLEPPSGSDLVIVESKVIGCSFVAAPSYLAKYCEPKDLEDLIQNHRICGKLINYRYLKEWKDIMSRGAYISFASNSNHSIANVVRSGGGIGIMVHDETRDTDLVRLKNITMKPQMTFYLVAHRLTKDIPKIRAVLEFYRKVLLNVKF